MFWAESWPSVRDHLRNRKWDFNKGRIGVAQFENRRWSLIARFALSTSGHNHLHWIHSTAKIFTEASTVQTKWNQEMRKYGRLVLYYWLRHPFSWSWKSYRDKKKKNWIVRSTHSGQKVTGVLSCLLNKYINQQVRPFKISFHQRISQKF